MVVWKGIQETGALLVFAGVYGEEKLEPKNKPQNITYFHSLKTIDELKNDDIIINIADKGGAIVIWPTKDYLTEAYRQLNNENHYQRFSHDPTPQILTD